MLLKPATPLSVLLFAAFALLLLSTLSTPVIKAIPLATYQNVDFGVFGYCTASQCSKARVGYDTENIFGSTDNSNGEFNLPSSARNSLSGILVVHPVAALLTLICFVMAVASHFHSPSHSPRYLLALLILLLPTVLVTLLAFLVDVLLFVPHLQWGGWIVLAATIILVACGVVTCAMRRTLVSRKARKKIVAENAEMSGENFYARQNAEAAVAHLAKAESPPPLPTDAKTPLINTNSHSDSAPTFTSYDSSRTPDDVPGIPSNSGFSTPGERGVYDYASRGPGYNNGQRDEYGNSIPPAVSGPSTGEAGVMRSNSDRMLQNQYSEGSLGSQQGMPQGYAMSGHPARGRGYPPRGGYVRGGPGGPGGQAPYANRGRGPPLNSRGGSMRGMRGGPGGVPPGNMGRGRGPPPGYPPSREGVQSGYDQYGGMSRRPSDGAGYGLNRSNSNNYSRPYPNRNSASSQPNLPETGEAGRAIEMMPQSSEPNLRIRNPDFAEPARFSNNRSLPSPSSVYSTEPYVPPRAAWAPGRSGPERGMSNSPRQRLSDYYEDVEPRFAEDSEIGPVGADGVPSVLMAGKTAGEMEPPPPLKITGENVAGGPESPAISDVSQGSHFTSISQRPINPNWHGQGPVPAPAPPPLQVNRGPRMQDMVLQGNPDFELPGASRGGGRGGGPRYGQGGRMTPVVENRF